MNTDNYNSCTFPLNKITNKFKYINNNNILAHYLRRRLVAFTWFHFETYVCLQYVKSTVKWTYV